MSLCFSGPHGTVEQRWIVYALLRDNIQHHLEGGQARGEFAEVHRVAAALGGALVALDARRLQDEMQKAQGLLERRIEDLAVSARTLAVLEAAWPPEGTDHTMLVSECGRSIPWIDPDLASLDQVFGHLVRALLAITAESTDGDVVEVWDQ